MTQKINRFLLQINFEVSVYKKLGNKNYFITKENHLAYKFLTKGH